MSTLKHRKQDLPVCGLLCAMYLSLIHPYVEFNQNLHSSLLFQRDQGSTVFRLTKPTSKPLLTFKTSIRAQDFERTEDVVHYMFVGPQALGTVQQGQTSYPLFP